MGNSCQTPQHEDAGRFNAQNNFCTAAGMALSIASDYERWGYLRRAIKWYDIYQRCMAYYVFVQFEDCFNERAEEKEDIYDLEELESAARDELINHAQAARNMYAYRCSLAQRYLKANGNSQDPPPMYCPEGVTRPQWSMWIELVSEDDDIEDRLERMGVLQKQSRATRRQMLRKQAMEEAAAAMLIQAAQQSNKPKAKAKAKPTIVDIKPNITVNPVITTNISGATANPTMAQTGSGPVTGGAASASYMPTGAPPPSAAPSNGPAGTVPMMQPIQTPNGLLHPMMTPQGLMYVPMAASFYGAPPPATAADPSFAYAPSAPPMGHGMAPCSTAV